MSSRVSSASSATAAAGSAAGSGALGAGAGARNASAAGPGPNPGPAAGCGASFSSVIADAAIDGASAGAKSAGAGAGSSAKPGKTKASGNSEDTDVDSGNGAAPTPGNAAAANATPTAASVTARDVSTDAAPANQSPAQPQSSAVDAAGNVRAGRPARPGGAARSAGKDTAPTATSDPVVLAMLLAASGMQMSAGANGAAVAAGNAPADAGSDREAAIAVTGDATGSAAGALSAQPAQPAQAAQAAPTARDVPAQLPDARTAAASIDGASSDPAAQAAVSAPSASHADAASISTGAAGLPELVRSFTINGPQGAVVEATIPVPVSSAGWPHAVAAQVHWFVNNDVQSATLRLSPDHLGPVEVHIDVQQSQVNVNFSAANADTRAALEQTVPRLREIFASGGLTLGQTNVQADPRSGSQPTAPPVRSALAHVQTVEPVAVAPTHSLGLVDEYA
jgi:flagellar hook-length control protein FliK